ncbi:MAG TPA: lantibiotic dehydratase, partial [Herpetosiphonaceae bacterium]
MSSLDERIAALSPEQRELLLQRMKNRGLSSPGQDAPRKHDDLVDDHSLQPQATRSVDHVSAAAAVPDAQVPAEHLIRVPGGAWMLWRSVVLRGAGFPANLVLNLAPAACRAAADQLIEAESKVQAAENGAAAAVNAALDALRRDEQWHDSARREPLIQLLRAIRRRKVAQVAGYSAEMTEALDALQAALIQHAAAQTNYRLAFDQSVRDVSQAVYAVSRDHRFREAVIWQNRRAYHTGVRLLQPPGEKLRNSRQRQHEELIASYVQRYCVKNDTIGFFGPVGWAELRSAGAAITVQAGAKLLANRSVYFEGWCIDALGETLAQNEALLPWVAPRHMPFLHLEGDDLFLPLAPPARLSPQQTALLRAIDGRRTARQLAQDLIAEAVPGLHTEQQVYDLLHELRAQRRIAWTLEVSAEDGYPEQHLRRLLERVEDEALRDSALHMLEELERSRDDVVRAAGDADALDRAQSQLEATFTRLTGGSPTRNAGQMYASRALLYEDCRRDAEVALGPDFLATLGPPLTLLLTSARWFTYQVASAYRRVFERTYRTLAQKAGSPVVHFADFWLYVQPFILGDDTRIMDS